MTTQSDGLDVFLMGVEKCLLIMLSARTEDCTYCLIVRVFGCEGGGVWIVRLSSERPSKSLGSILGIEFEAAALRFL